MTDMEALIRQDFNTVMGIPEGKRVLGNIFFLARHNEMSLDLKSPMNTAFLEGCRFVGVQLENLIGLKASYECLEAFKKFSDSFAERDDADGR